MTTALHMSTPPVREVPPGTLITFVFGPDDFAAPDYASYRGTAIAVYHSPMGDVLRVKLTSGLNVDVRHFTRVGRGAYCWL